MCVCVFVALGIQHARHMQHSAICGLQPSTKLSNIFSKMARPPPSKLMNTKCLFSYSLQLLSQTSLILTTNERVMKTNSNRSTRTVLFILVRF